MPTIADLKAQCKTNHIKGYSVINKYNKAEWESKCNFENTPTLEPEKTNGRKGFTAAEWNNRHKIVALREELQHSMYTYKNLQSKFEALCTNNVRDNTIAALEKDLSVYEHFNSYLIGHMTQNMESLVRFTTVLQWYADNKKKNPTVYNGPDTDHTDSITHGSITRGVKDIVDIINKSAIDQNIVHQFQDIKDSLEYVAPEALVDYTHRFRKLCKYYKGIFARLGICDKINDILNGLWQVVHPTVNNEPDTDHTDSITRGSITRGVKDIVDIVNKSVIELERIDENIVHEFRGIKDSLEYVAPKALVDYTHRFRKLCKYYKGIFARLGIYDKINDILNGLGQVVHPTYKKKNPTYKTKNPTVNNEPATDHTASISRGVKDVFDTINNIVQQFQDSLENVAPEALVDYTHRFRKLCKAYDRKFTRLGIYDKMNDISQVVHPTVKNEPDTDHTVSITQDIFDIISSIVQRFQGIKDALEYVAPEELVDYTHRFSKLCEAYERKFTQLGKVVDTRM